MGQLTQQYALYILEYLYALITVSQPILLEEPFCSLYYYKSWDLNQLPGFNVITII